MHFYDYHLLEIPSPFVTFLYWISRLKTNSSHILRMVYRAAEFGLFIIGP